MSLVLLSIFFNPIELIYYEIYWKRILPYNEKTWKSLRYACASFNFSDMVSNKGPHEHHEGCPSLL